MNWHDLDTLASALSLILGGASLGCILFLLLPELAFYGVAIICLVVLYGFILSTFN